MNRHAMECGRENTSSNVSSDSTQRDRLKKKKKLETLICRVPSPQYIMQMVIVVIGRDICCVR